MVERTNERILVTPQDNVIKFAFVFMFFHYYIVPAFIAFYMAINGKNYTTRNGFSDSFAVNLH